MFFCEKGQWCQVVKRILVFPVDHVGCDRLAGGEFVSTKVSGSMIKYFLVACMLMTVTLCAPPAFAKFPKKSLSNCSAFPTYTEIESLLF